jgi:phosphoglucosamine mutase
LSEQEQNRLEETYRLARDSGEVPGAGRAPGSLEEKSDWAAEAYIAGLLAGARCRLDGRRVVVDHASGAAWKVLPRVLTELGATVFSVAPDPNGKNINEGTGAVHPEAAARMVVEEDAWAGVVVDGDGDRIYLVDEGGVIHDGDAIVGTLAGALVQEGKLRGGAVVGTVTTGAGLEAFLAARGIELIRTAVGDRHVAMAMDAKGCNLGGESSGHVLTPDLCPSGDGSRVALELLGRAITGETSLSDLLRAIPRFPIARRKVDAGQRPPLEGLRGLQEVLREADEVLGSAGGRQLLRYSGTEPVLRVQVEGKDADLVEAWADRIATAANKAIVAVQ